MDRNDVATIVCVVLLIALYLYAMTYIIQLAAR